MDPWIKCSLIGAAVLAAIVVFKALFQHAWGRYNEKYDRFDARGYKMKD